MSNINTKKPDAGTAIAKVTPTISASSPPAVDVVEADADRVNTSAADEAQAPQELEVEKKSEPEKEREMGTEKETKEETEKDEEMKDPLYLECSTLDSMPLHVQQMLNQFSQDKLSAAEFLVVLIYIVALESGFAERQSYIEMQAELKPVPAVSSFHSYNVRLLTSQPVRYTKEFNETAFHMLLHTIPDEKSWEEAITLNKLQSYLMAVQQGDQLVVTLSPKQPSEEPGYSILLSIGRYVLNVKLDPVYQRFRNLNELSLLLRQHLFYPMRAQQLHAIKKDLYPSLLGLPLDVYYKIFEYLSTNQLNILANVNKLLCEYSTHYKVRCQ